MKGNKLWKIFSTIIVLIFIVTCVYLMVGSVSSKGILKSYNAVKPDSASGFNKTLLFLQSYTQTTGDTSLAIKKGMSQEDAEELANGGTIVDPGDGSTNTGGGVTYASGRTAAEIEQALSARASGEGDAGEYYSTSSGAWEITDVNGSAYLVEVQGSGKWAAVSNPDGSVGSVGCFMFACSTAINALNMSTVSIADIMPVARASDTSISYSSSSHSWTGRADSVGYDGTVDAGIFNEYNLNFKSLNSKGITGEEARQIMANEGFDNCVYIIYGHKSGVLSSGSNHWTVCVGTTDSSIYILNNGSRDVEIPVDTISNSGAITHILKISK